MSSNNSNSNNSSNGRSAFATSSTDFALPFANTARPTNASLSSSSSSSNTNGGMQGYFSHTASSSSAPISIPSSPSSSLNFGQNSQMLSLSGGTASSPSRLAIPSGGGAGLGIGNLPSPSAREQANPLAQSITFNGQPHSPTLSLAGEGWPPPPFTSFPSASSSSSSAGVTTPAGLLRRTQGMNSPGFGLASPARYRRASMLGREITPFHLDQQERSDDEDQARNASSSAVAAAQQSTNSGTEANQDADADDGDDEMMQVEEEDATVSRAPSTPVMGPPLSLFSTPNTPPPSTASHLPSTRPSMPSSALSRASTSDSGQDSSSSTGNGNGGTNSSMGLSRTVPRSPSTGPSMGSPLGHGGNRSRSSSLLSSNVVRKAVTRRGNLLPRDRSVLRVAASLVDESKPEDSEIASEAKLQKRLGGEATLPRTPRFGPSSNVGVASGGHAGVAGGGASRSPFFGASAAGGTLAPGFSRRKYMWDDDVDDIRGVFAADGLDDGDSSAMSSEEEEMLMYYSRTDSLSDEEDELRSHANIMQEDGPSLSSSQATAIGRSSNNNNNNGSNETHANAAISTSFGGTTPVTSGNGGAGGGGVGSLPKRKNNSLWMGFRDKGNAHKWSPGSGSAAASASAGGASGGVFTNERSAWRRGASTGGGTGMDVDTSPRVLNPASGSGARLSKRKTMGDDRYEPYKRRAVSPMNLGSSLGTTPTNAGFAQTAANATTQTQNSRPNSPLLMPISSPSTNVLYRAGFYHHHHHYANANRYSTSPTISRPCTPVNSTTSGGGVVGMGSFSPAAGSAGSGPGYGSGALGLSISANGGPQSLESRVQMEQQQENEALMDQRVGMLGLS